MHVPNPLFHSHGERDKNNSIRVVSGVVALLCGVGLNLGSPGEYFLRACNI